MWPSLLSPWAGELPTLQILGCIQVASHVQGQSAVPILLLRDHPLAIATNTSMPKDFSRSGKTDPRVRRQLALHKGSGNSRLHTSTGTFKKRMTEEELMDLEILEMSGGGSQERVASYFEWQVRSSRPLAIAAPAPRVSPIKRLFFRLTGRG